MWLSPTNHRQVEWLLGCQLGQDAVDVVDAGHHAVVSVDDQVTCTDAGLGRRPVRVDIRDLNGLLTEQI